MAAPARRKPVATACPLRRRKNAPPKKYAPRLAKEQSDSNYATAMKEA
jgi:hypothetical protein